MTRQFWRDAAQVLNQVSMYFVAFAALAAIAYTLLCAAGVYPWFGQSAFSEQISYADTGMYMQIGFTVVMAMVASFLPTAIRMSLLENSHRNFHLKMEDVAKAYYYCHAADRSGVFELSSEFDAVRERLAYLRDHPELGNLEPGILEVAAQMSVTAKDLAANYSDANVGRAKLFLRQRQEEVSKQQKRIKSALRVFSEIESWDQKIIENERVNAVQMDEIKHRLGVMLPDFDLEIVRRGSNVLPLKDVTS